MAQGVLHGCSVSDFTFLPQGDCRNRYTVTPYKTGATGRKLALLFPRRPELLMGEVTEV